MTTRPWPPPSSITDSQEPRRVRPYALPLDSSLCHGLAYVIFRFLRRPLRRCHAGRFRGEALSCHAPKGNPFSQLHWKASGELVLLRRDSAPSRCSHNPQSRPARRGARYRFPHIPSRFEPLREPIAVADVGSRSQCSVASRRRIIPFLASLGSPVACPTTIDGTRAYRQVGDRPELEAKRSYDS